MKSVLYLFLLTFLSGAFLSCDGDDEEDFLAWRTANEAAFAGVYADSANYKAITMDGVYPGIICVKVIKSGPETGERPLLGDRVSAFYKGSFYNGDVFDNGTTINEVPATFLVNSNVNGSIILGFSIALQHMRPGDRWEVWIPWHLGYGDAANGDIPPFSTLVFDLELLRVLD